MVIPKHIYKKIEKYLYGYTQLVEIYEIDEADILFGKKTGVSDGSKTNKVSKSTEERALKLIEEKEKYAIEKKWLHVIRKTIEHFIGTDCEQIIELNYIEQIRLNKILIDIHMEKNAFYTRKNDIITYATFQALDNGLITIKEIEKGNK